MQDRLRRYSQVATQSDMTAAKLTFWSWLAAVPATCSKKPVHFMSGLTGLLSGLWRHLQRCCMGASRGGSIVLWRLGVLLHRKVQPDSILTLSISNKFPETPTREDRPRGAADTWQGGTPGPRFCLTSYSVHPLPLHSQSFCKFLGGKALQWVLL